MNPNPENQVNPDMVEQARRQVNRLAEEIAQMSETEVEPPVYYGEFLQRVLAALAAPAGAVWLFTPQGNLQLQYQIRMRDVGLDETPNAKDVHNELLRQAVTRAQPAMLAPQSGLGAGDEGEIQAGNPTNFVVLLAPILVERQVAGLVEVWQDPNRGQDAQRGFMQFLVRMASMASSYTRNHQLRQMNSQQQVWTQLENFAKAVHGSLNPTEVAYQAANEGRRLVQCDRVCVGVRESGKVVVRAVSGADVVEKRSNLVVCMRQLFDEVLTWNEKLVHTGSKDEALPPKVLRALDAYLEESNSKLLVVEPLRDPREKNTKKPARSVLMMEAFEPTVPAEQLMQRMDVISKHATPALYNAWEYRRIPFRLFWYPLAKIQEGLGGKAKAIILAVTFLLVAIITMLIVVPYPLKMDASGQLMPKRRGWIFAPLDGHIVYIKPDLKSGSRVSSRQGLLQMHSPKLEQEVTEMRNAVSLAKEQIESLQLKLNARDKNYDKATLADMEARLVQAKATLKAKRDQEDLLRERISIITNKPGYFWLEPPINGKLLTSDFREVLSNKYVQPNEPLLLVGDVPVGAPNPEFWEISLKIPQKHIGQILAAYKTSDPKEELDVDFLLVSQPTQVYKGRLAQQDVSSQAIPDRTDNNEAEAVVLAKVRLSGPNIPKENQMPPSLLLTGTEVHARIRCGDHAMGYSLFYGVWEFFYEKVVFFF